VHRTHELACDHQAFPDVLAAVFDAAMPRLTSVEVLLREKELDTPPDGQHCKETWKSVVEEFERVPDADRHDCTAWRLDPGTDASRAAVLDLVALTEGSAGSHFVFEVRGIVDEIVVLHSIPHHSSLTVDATQLEETWIDRVSGRLDDHPACLVPLETEVEWIAEGQQYSLDGFSLCTAAPDGQSGSCYGLANLRAVDRQADGTTLELTWDTGGTSDHVLLRALHWLVKQAYRPPSTLPCETEQRANQVEEVLRTRLESYDGREL
jgi:hypothetical protein